MNISWVLGFLIAMAWVGINFALLKFIVKQAVVTRSRQWVPFLLFLKFPVLYVGGYYILRSGSFPVASILAGITAMFVIVLIVGVHSLWRMEQQTGRYQNSPI
ncbi:MAG: hypothetical protein PHS37_02830 [Candidatus Omnitrophica bacterium]|nr:hypothetical protein [Candidatus Omnitrophota bacterium]